MVTILIRRLIIFATAFLLCAFSIEAQSLVPVDVGTTVHGFQDDFDGTKLNSAWLPVGENGIYAVSDGILHISTAQGDPNHLLYAVAGYDSTTQEVLARIRVTAFGTGDSARGGIGAGVDSTSSQGINFFFRDFDSEGQSGRHVAFLDDLRAWGPGFEFPWQDNKWYWMRLRQEPNAASQGGADDIFAKIWPADGTVAEPATWLTWEYDSSRSTRQGYAGITAGSSGGTSELDVDYILIKAEGLPEITAAPRAFPLFTPGPVTITNQPANITVTQCGAATFTVSCNGTPPYSFQWLRDGLPVPNATNNSYTLTGAQGSGSGTVFSVIAKNSYNSSSYQITSSNAVLTVTPDTTPPALVRVENAGLDNLTVVFSRAVALSATNLSNYSISDTNGILPILSAMLINGGTNIVLTTQGQVEGLTYTLTVNNIVDQCTGSNVIARNSTADFQAQSYAAITLGGTNSTGRSEAVSGGYRLTSSGTGLFGNADQAQFSFTERTGDFDVRVRVANLSGSDAFSEAGLMARESLDASSRFAAVLGTPSISGAIFKARTDSAATVNTSGSFPVNYPDTWLRLQRRGTVLSGYASFDGMTWTELGSTKMGLPASVYLGFVTGNHTAGHDTTAVFQDFGDVDQAVIGTPRLNREPLGQASRTTSLVISEIMYHPLENPGGNSLEYIEIFNSAGTSEDISGFRIDGDIHYTFPPGTIIGPGAFLVVACYPLEVEQHYGISGVLGPFNGNLPNDSGTVRLRNPVDALFLDVHYESTDPWPVAADGAGHSLILARPSFGQGNPAAWQASTAVGGSPGKLDILPSDPLRGVVLNEIMAHGTAGNDYIELFNTGSTPLDVSGSFLSDDPETNKFTIPAGSTIPPHGFLSFDSAQLGFSLKSSGESIFFRAADNHAVLDAVRYSGLGNNISFGRRPDGGKRWSNLAGPTPGDSNSEAYRSDIVINEIMYAPISRDDSDQYIELYNRGSVTIDLSGWKFTQGITFTFPTNTLLNAESFLVIAQNAARLRSNYINLNSSNVIGDLAGKLSGKGERLVLVRPDQIVSTNAAGGVSTNTVYFAVQDLVYGNGGRWGEWSDGGGSSLELINPEADNSFAPNWADSDETTKAPWTTVQVSGTIDNGSTGSADQLQVLLQGAGECLIDDVQVLNSNGANLIANSSFESGANGWTAEGTERTSSLETTEGYNSSRSYHIRAVDRGDNQVNRVRVPLTTALTSGSKATISARVRWLRGHPEILFRLRGNWMEAPCEMNLPVAPGTPGARNSRYVPSAPPAITDVTHFPVLPGNGEPVLITARIAAGHGAVATANLRYRLDPATAYNSVPMHDDGMNGDFLAGDGVFTAGVPGQGTGSLMAYYVEVSSADSGFSAMVSATFPADAPTRECLVRFGETEPPGNIPVYRIWMTQATLDRWKSRNKLDNSPLDITFVYGSRRVIYNTQALYAGSPYIAPGYCGPACGRCGYSISFPTDEPFLGDTDLVLDWPGGHGGESTAIQEQMAYWIANQIGLPFSHRYFIHLHVNGVTDEDRGTIFEAVNQPAGDFLKAWSSKSSNGDFYKVDRGFEFNDGGGLIADPMPTLQVFKTTGGVKKQARYRWNWNKRSSDDCNNYTNIFNLVDAVNAASPEPYTSATESLLDIEEWMGIFAVEHIINNFDSWGHDIGKNMYVYKPDDGKWQLYMFDLDWLMLVAGQRYSAQNGPLFVSNDPTVSRMYNHPPFRRAYFRAVLDAVNGPMASNNYEPVMDEKYASLVANGVRYCDGKTLTSPSALKSWFQTRRNYLVGQLAAVDASFTVTGSGEIDASSNPVTLSGTAPVEVRSILINGAEWPVTWTTVTTWTATYPVHARSTALTISGLDKRGNPVQGASSALTIHYTGPLDVLPTVVVNEWMASNTKTVADLSSGTPKYDDWFELYNYGTNTVDLGGLYLTDSAANRFQFQIPAGYTLPAGGHLLVWADGEPEQNSGPGADLHAAFKLSADGESIGLFAADGTQIDLVNFNAQAPDLSEGRCPDGSTNIVVLGVATPRAANQCATLPSVSDVDVREGSVIFSWNVTPGLLYRVEFKNELNDPAWTAEGEATLAGSETFSATIQPSAPHRFYRLVPVN